MADLSKFTAEERTLIVSIPYRVGAWISECDDNTGSNIDEREERKTMEATISGLAKQNKASFAAVVMQGVEQSKPSWSSWTGEGEDKLFPEVEKAIQLCKEKAGDKALAQYKQTIWRMGVAVAQAYGEQIDPDNELHFNRVFQWVGSLTSGANLGKKPENISKSEKTALNKLRAILKE